MNALFQLQLEIDLKHTNSPQSDRCFTGNLPIGIPFTGVNLLASMASVYSNITKILVHGIC